jgi:hypothetical protein
MAKQRSALTGALLKFVDTYSADDIWRAAIYRKEFATTGRHTIHLEVVGEQGRHPNARSKDTLVFVDGIRVEMQ